MDIGALYASRLMTADQAAALVPSGSRLSMGMFAAEPPAVLQAIADRAAAGLLDGVRVYYYEGSEIAGKTILRYDLNDRIKPFSMFLTQIDRNLITQGLRDNRRDIVHHVPSTFHQAVRLLQEEIRIDTFVHTVSPMDRHGYFSFGTGNDYSTRLARSAQRLIVEVNENMPRVQGERTELHVSEVDAIVENHVPLLEVKPRAASVEDEAISHLITSLVPDGACLQMGVGGLPNLVCAALKDHNDLGIHTEALNQGLVDLLNKGVVTNRRKKINGGKTVFAFAMGDRALYDFIDENPAIESWPVDYVNDPRIIAQNDHVISINATLQIDLFGACNSEYIEGHQYSAAGGQLDFVRGAYASRGGKSFIVTRSTAREGQVSRIVPQLNDPVTTPRIDTHYVVTEFGVANLKGLSMAERARAIIGLAHPQFRDELTHAARRMYLI